LLLISPRTSYYYFPAVMLTAVSLYTVFEAVRVMFEQYKLKKREDGYISQLVTRVFTDSLNVRVTTNSFFEDLKEQKRISHSLLEIGRDKNTKVIEIKSTQDGIIRDVPLTRLSQLMSQQFSTLQTQVTDTAKTKVKEDKSKQEASTLPKLVLQIRPGVTIKKQDNLMRLILPKNSDNPSASFLNGLKRTVQVTIDHPDSANNQLDFLLDDFKQQLREAVKEDNVATIKQPLDFYKLLTKGLDVLSNADNDSGYTFAEARKEFNQWFGDSVSERLRKIADALNEEFLHAIRDKKQDATRAIIDFVYHDVLERSSNFNILSAARADESMVFAINRLIFSDDTDMPDMDYRLKVSESIFFRLKEHTGLLLYYYRGDDEDVTYSKEQIDEWLKSRMNDARGFMLGAYKKSSSAMFIQAKQIFDEFSEDYNLYREDVEDLFKLAQCQLFLIAAYMHDRADEDAEQKKCHDIINDFLKGLSAQQLTEILVKCTDENYAHNWNVDMYDSIPDGKVRSVPDYAAKLKAIWTEYMLQIPSIPQDVASYAPTPLDETQTFTEYLSKIEDTSIIKHLDALPSTQTNVNELKQLVTTFFNARKQWETDKLVKEPLEDSKVVDFRNDVLKGYTENALSIKALQKAGKLQFIKTASNGYINLGWNTLRDKPAFIKDWYSGYILRGEEYGSQIANAENEHIASKLLVSPTQFSTFEDWIGKLRNNNDEWLILNIGVGSWYLRGQPFAKDVKNNSEYHDIYFKRIKQLLPAQFMYSNTIPKGLYAVRVKHLGNLKIEGTQAEPVGVLIDAYSHNTKLLNQILKSPPAWLTKKGDKTAQENFLKTMVRMLIKHPFRYNPDKNAEVLFFPIERDY